jgi:hypothetical protein
MALLGLTNLDAASEADRILWLLGCGSYKPGTNHKTAGSTWSSADASLTAGCGQLAFALRLNSRVIPRTCKLLVSTVRASLCSHA